MATYKVLQDIEAEDKFVGPLTLKQFIFAMGGALFGYLSFFAITKGATWALIFLMPICLFGFFMAFPWSKEQPTDVWVLAKIRFRIKNRKRVWDQAGMQELVTITAPKKMEKILTNNLSQTEVKSRLKALADTIDSRGWIVKHSSFQESHAMQGQDSDRLIDTGVLSRQVPALDEAMPDMLEGENNLDSLIEHKDQDRKAQIYEKMDRIRNGESLESINQPEAIVSSPEEVIPTEQSIIASLKAKREAGDVGQKNLHKISSQLPSTTLSTAQNDNATNMTVKEKTEVNKAQASVTEQSSPDILNLAQNNDLNVSTLARQASGDDDQNGSGDEVVISLH